MRLLDIYYRAFRKLRDETTDNTSRKLRKTIAHANQQNDFFTSTKYSCSIQMDWIENIEAGLIYVEKAIREDRQFIRTEGEVVRIEKVKKVSKASVEHLSRHSNLITRKPKDNKNLIPDKLYMVEKLSDYLVYENRFLYMLLCYLRDFIQMRIDKIFDKTTTYKSNLKMDKLIEVNQRRIKYLLTFDELSKNDPFLVEKYKQMPGVHRIETMFAVVSSLLSTPLMRDVAKAPMIKPPVVKTNVLRMNPNFRAALKLYDYIMSYNKDGFTFEEIIKSSNPLKNEMSDQVAETIELHSLITYMEGNEIEELLNERYLKVLDDEESLKIDKFNDDLKRLKKRIIEMNEDPAEYILRLEKRNIDLEKETKLFKVEKEKTASLTIQVEELEKEVVQLSETINQLKNKIIQKEHLIDELNQKYFNDMTDAENLHQKEMLELNQKFKRMIEDIKSEHEIYITAMLTSHLQEKEQLMTSYEKKLNELIDKYESETQTLIASYDAKIAVIKDEHIQLQDKLKLTYETQINEMTQLHKKNVLSLNQDHLVIVEAFEQKIKHLNLNILDFEALVNKKNQEYQQKDEETKMRILSLEKELETIDDLRKFSNAQYHALQMQQGLITGKDDFSSKNQFQQLELEMIAYKKLFKEQWKKAKLDIRDKAKKQVFNEEQESSKQEQ